MKRPISLIVVAALFIFVGVYGIVNELVQFGQGGFELEQFGFGIINTLAGVGLFKLWRGWHVYALGIIGFFFVIVIIGGFILPLSIRFFDFPHIPRMIGQPLNYSNIVPFVALLGCMLWTLLRRDVRVLFQRKIDLSATPHRCNDSTI